MDNVNKTLYIPLYGKALVSKKGIIIDDKKAELIWESESFELKGKSKSNWLAYYMAMRSKVFDDWLTNTVSEDTIILHIGCGMDSRCCRVNCSNLWYDIDFESVITERKKYYQENDHYHMLVGDLRDCDWLSSIPSNKKAIVILEGVSMYLTTSELKQAFVNLSNHFESLAILMDCYSILAAKASKHKNPINDVGVTLVYGLDDPKVLCGNGIEFTKEYELTPAHLISELSNFEQFIFKRVYAGGFAKKLYRLYEFKK